MVLKNPKYQEKTCVKAYTEYNRSDISVVTAEDMLIFIRQKYKIPFLPMV